METKTEFGVRDPDGVVRYTAMTRGQAEEIVTRREGYHREWHEGAGYGKDDYADPGTVVSRVITKTSWEPVFEESRFVNDIDDNSRETEDS